ncbi:MAG: GtrA family protein [Limisphaerales bacterium]
MNVFDWLKARRQFVVYCLIGASGVALDFSIYSLLVAKFPSHYQWANAAGYSSGTILSFFLNAHFNFKTRDWLLARFLSFCLVGFLGWAASAEVLSLTIGLWHWNKYLAKLLTLAVVVALQYNLNRLISFKRGRAS